MIHDVSTNYKELTYTAQPILKTRFYKITRVVIALLVAIIPKKRIMVGIMFSQ